MKPIAQTVSPIHFHIQRFRQTLPLWAGAGVLLAFLSLAPAVRAANGTPDYLDVNGTTAGFGTPSGTYTETNVGAGYWDTSAAGTGTPANFVAKDSMVFTNAPTDATGAICTINLNADDDVNGFVNFCTNSIITLGGVAAGDQNDHFANSGITIVVVPGSTFIWADTRNSGSAAPGGGGSGGFNMNNEGVTFSGGGTNIFNTYFGNNDNATMTVNGATFTFNYSTPLADMKGGNYTGPFTLTSGNLNFASANSLDAFSELTNGNLVSINGGTIDNISGAPIKLITTNLISYSIGGNFIFNGSNPLDLGSEGVTNAGNNTITVNASVLAIGGNIRGNGNGLTLAGAGTLLLYGTNSYSGGTLVGSGTLALTNFGSIANSPLTVNSNATFDVSGLSAATSLPSLSVTNSTLVVSGLSAATTNVMAGTLNVGGTTNIINVASLPLVTSYPAIFPILGGATVNGTLNFGLGILPASQSYAGYITNLPASGSVVLVLTSGPAPVLALTWSGTNAGVGSTETWDVGNTADWLETNGTPMTYGQLDFVTFNDTAPGSAIVNLTQQLTPGNLTVSNNALAYTFTGGYLSDGLTSLTLNKQGSGTLTLQESGDNFSGGINVAGGTVIMDNYSGSINGGATIGTGATLQLGNNDTGDALPAGTVNLNGSLVFNCADTPNVANAITGSGAVSQVNTNLVTLSGTSSGSWTTTIMNGTLQAANNFSLGAIPGGLVTVTNGGTFDIGGNTSGDGVDFGTKQFNIAGAGVNGNGAIVNSYNANQEDAFQNIVLTTNATVGGPYRWDIRNGTPVLNLNGYTLTVTNTPTIALVAATVTPGNLVIQPGSTLAFQLGGNVTGAGTITANPGAFIGLYESALNSLTRDIVLNGGGITNQSGSGETAYVNSPILMATSSTLGNSYFTTTIYDGAISDGGQGFSLSSTGGGTNLLAGTNTYTGNTYVLQATLGLTNYGSIYNSPVIAVNNGTTFDISGLAMPFSGTNAIYMGDDVLGQGTFNIGYTVVTNFNYLSISNAVLNLAVANPNAPNITVANLNLGDGNAGSQINISALPVLTPSQFPLIKYASVSGVYSLNLGSLPPGYSGSLVNNTGNHSIDLLLTSFPAGTWNGGGSPDNDWSDSANWNNANLTGNDPLVFTGILGLNNTNDEGNETATSVTFVAGAGAFSLNGNPITLAGNVVNSSANPQAINLGLNLSLSSGTNLTLNAGTAGMTITGAVTNTQSTIYTLHLQGTNGVLAGPLQSGVAGSPYNLGVSLDASAGGSNTWSIVGNNVSALTNVTIVGPGGLTFGTGADAPSLAVTNDNGTGAITVGTTTNTASTFTMNSGTLCLTNGNNAPLDLGTTGATGIFDMNGGTLYLNGKYLMIGDAASSGTFNLNGGSVTAVITNDIILGNSINNSTGTVNIVNGTFNATANNDFYVGFRGQGTWNVSSNGLLELQTLNMTRNASDSDNASGTLNLNGGLVIMTNETMGNAATGQTGAINFNGGVMEASGASTNFISPPASPSVLTTTVKVGGAIINDGGFAIAILSPLVHDPSLGAASDGGLVKTGSGTLTLGGANTYNGPTTASNGTLLVNGSLGTNIVTVNASATLGGGGVIGGNVTNNGTIAPGTITASALLTDSASVVFGSAATSQMKLDLNNATNDELSAGGTLTYSGTLNVTVLSGTPAANNSFKLFNAASYAGGFTATNLPALSNGLVWNWNPTSGTLSVVQNVNTDPATANFQAVSAAGSLQFTWDPGHLGWQLYTNAVGLSVTNDWFPVSGSAAVTNETISINPAAPNVFFQLRYP